MVCPQGSAISPGGWVFGKNVADKYDRGQPKSRVRDLVVGCWGRKED